MSSYDVIIVWAGPAWLTTGIVVKQHIPQARILIVDKQDFPRFKIGEALLPWTIKILDKIGCLWKVDGAKFIKKIWAYYFWWKFVKDGFFLPFNSFHTQWKNHDKYSNIISYHVERSKYDAVILDFAREQWIDIITWKKIDKISWDESDFISSITLSDGHILSSRYYVDATWFLPWFISADKRWSSSCWDFFWNICFHWYLKGASFIQDFSSVWGVSTTVTALWNGAWTWYIPLSEDVISVWMVFNSQKTPEFLLWDKEEVLFSALKKNPKINTSTQNAAFFSYMNLPRVSVIKNRNWFSKNSVWENWFLVGDAAFFSDPILSSWVTMAHRLWFQLGNVIKEILSSDNEKWNNLLKEDYKNFVNESYAQVSKIIQFWYEWMDGNYDLTELFWKADDTIKKYGIINKSKKQFSFWYIVNGLLQSIDDWEWEYNMLNFWWLDQQEFQEVIKIVTWINIDINWQIVSENSIYYLKCPFKILKKPYLSWGKFTIGRKIYIENEYKSEFYINDTLNNILLLINWKSTLIEIYNKCNFPLEYFENVKKDIEKLIYLWLLWIKK
jgi:FAD-dependent halogenase